MKSTLAERLAGERGPRITEDDVNGAILTAQYHHFEGTTQTICCITMTNGFTVVGSSACADPVNFDAQLGKDLAFKDARDQVWYVLGYQLREDLYQAFRRSGGQAAAGPRAIADMAAGAAAIGAAGGVGSLDLESHDGSEREADAAAHGQKILTDGTMVAADTPEIPQV